MGFTDRVRRYWKKAGLVLIGCLLFVLASAFYDSLSVFHSLRAQPLTVAVDRWLEVRNLSGQVVYRHGREESPARVGIRLQSVGDGIKTLQNSTARLGIDSGVGFVNLAENTSLEIQSLATASSGGKITQLQVLSGQVRLEVPTFTNPDSRLEIQTPSGWSGVRGTEFGLAVRPDGSTGTATLSGSVATSAQGQAVVVDGGFQNLTFPGESPTKPTPLTDDTTLSITAFSHDDTSVYLSGYTDPVNLLQLEGIPQIIDREGAFEIAIPRPEASFVRALVITPLGKEQAYEIRFA